MAIFIIFSTPSILVFKSMGNILVNDLMKLFFSTLSPIILSKSSCILFVGFSVNLKGPSVESPSGCSSVM